MQLIFPITQLQSYSIDDFIVSSCNSIVYDTIINWPNMGWGRAPYNLTLLLAGPKSSGKTYIAKIWQTLSGAYIITPQEQFSSQILNQYNAFVIDDISLFNKEDELLHWFNLINEHKKHLLITSALPFPSFNIQDLSSRFNSLFSVKIDQPDEKLIEMLLFKNFSNFSTIISPKVLKFLAFNLPRQFDKILELTDEINQVALSNNRKITTNLVKNIIQKSNN